jgi:hypothetical protein
MGETRNAFQSLKKSLNGNDQLIDLSIRESIILELILKK